MSATCRAVMDRVYDALEGDLLRELYEVAIEETIDLAVTAAVAETQAQNYALNIEVDQLRADYDRLMETLTATRKQLARAVWNAKPENEHIPIEWTEADRAVIEEVKATVAAEAISNPEEAVGSFDDWDEPAKASPVNGGNILAMDPPEPVADFPPVRMVEPEKPCRDAVDPKEIATMLGSVTPLSPMALGSADRLLSLIVALVAGKAPTEAARELDIRPNVAGVWAGLHKKHVTNPKKLVRAEAQQEYLRQLRCALLQVAA